MSLNENLECGRGNDAWQNRLSPIPSRSKLFGEKEFVNRPGIVAWPRRYGRRGTTLLELIMTISILLVLSTAAIPVMRLTVIRPREYELRRELREMRNAIDQYHELAGRSFPSVVGSEGYPPDLQTLVYGVELYNGGNRKIRFLRRIPRDPMTGKADWQLRSVQDDPDSQTWGGQDVFDVHSNSSASALDATKYSDW